MNIRNIANKGQKSSFHFKDVTFHVTCTKNYKHSVHIRKCLKIHIKFHSNYFYNYKVFHALGIVNKTTVHIYQ